MKKLHVISFDIPYPANYGGVIVVYHQLLALQKAGVAVILHAYQYGDRKPQKQLEECCESVYYYERNVGWRSSISQLPYIVNSRKSKALLDNLLKDDYPILFEGVHTTVWINHPQLKNRKKVIRMHNVEWQYYQSLQALATNPLRKYYFYAEAKRLKKYDDIALHFADAILTISDKDQMYYQSKHEASYMMPAPHGSEVDIKQGIGTYFLFHAKLSVEDNKRAALYLIKNVFANVSTPCIIAGMDPDQELRTATEKLAHVSINANPGDEEMKSMIQNAQANILYTFQDNGLKLKLLNALHLGRHCIVNPMMVSNANDLKELCHIGENAAKLVDLLKSIENEEFTLSLMEKRSAILNKDYNNNENTRKALLFLKKYGFN